MVGEFLSPKEEGRESASIEILIERYLQSCSQDQRQKLVAKLVQEWLHCGALRPDFTVNEGVYQFELLADNSAFPNLFGILAIKLALEVSGRVGMVRCDKCGDEHPLTLRASLDSNHYCERCRGANNNAACAAAGRRRRARIREALRLHSEGYSFKQIAEELNVKSRAGSNPVERVRRWISER